MQYPLLLECPGCGMTYDYADSEENLRQRLLPALPAGDCDRLNAPPDSPEATAIAS